MWIGAEASVARDDVSVRQLRMQISHVSHVVCPHRRDRHVVQASALGIEHREQVRDRIAAAGLLTGRLAEVLPKRVRVRHGEAGAVDQRHAMAVPERHVAGPVNSVGERVDDPLDDLQGKALARLTVRRSGELASG